MIKTEYSINIGCKILMILMTKQRQNTENRNLLKYNLRTVILSGIAYQCTNIERWLLFLASRPPKCTVTVKLYYTQTVLQPERVKSTKRANAPGCQELNYGRCMFLLPDKKKRELIIHLDTL